MLAALPDGDAGSETCLDAEGDAAVFHQQFAFPRESRRTKQVKVGACRLHPVKWSDGLTVEESSQE